MNIPFSTLYSFKNFTDLTEQESEEVLLGRNDPEVRRWMTSDRVIDLDEHNQFMAKLNLSKSQIYLRVERKGKFAGVYSLTNMQGALGVGGFWVTADVRQKLLSVNVVFQSIGYIFNNLPIKTIRGYQLVNNNAAAKLNALLGFKPCEELINADQRMQNLALTCKYWTDHLLCEPRLFKLMKIAENRNET